MIIIGKQKIYYIHYCGKTLIRVNLYYLLKIVNFKKQMKVKLNDVNKRKANFNGLKFQMGHDSFKMKLTSFL